MTTLPHTREFNFYSIIFIIRLEQRLIRVLNQHHTANKINLKKHLKKKKDEAAATTKKNKCAHCKRPGLTVKQAISAQIRLMYTKTQTHGIRAI